MDQRATREPACSVGGTCSITSLAAVDLPARGSVRHSLVRGERERQPFIRFCELLAGGHHSPASIGAAQKALSFLPAKLGRFGFCLQPLRPLRPLRPLLP